MFISNAFAAEAPAETSAAVSTATPADAPMPPANDAFLMNIGMVLVLAVLFYLLLIRPQQKRFKEHTEMINKMDKGSKVVTQGGLVGVIDKVVTPNEVIIDFGGNVKMTVMRSYIIGAYEETSASPANDTAKSKKDKSTK